MFTPKWKKEAKNFYKAGRKFLNFKRDLLKDDRISEIESRLRDLQLAMKGRGKEAQEKTEEAIRQLDNTCEQSLPRQYRPNPIGDQIESLFAALVIAIGIRSYYAQPFVIPTGSMQPTLNGVICEALDKEEWPNIAVRTAEMVLRGRTYVYKEAPRDLILDPRSFRPEISTIQNPGTYKIAQAFHRVTQLRFENAKLMAHGLPYTAFWNGGAFDLQMLVIQNKLERRNGKIIIPKGTVLYSGYADSGDVIIANKIAYHFRKPKRGEPFIFDTRGLDVNGTGSGMSDQANATHYIKRCVGIPGDTLSIDSPRLLIDGETATEPYIQRVIAQEGVYAENPGYILGKGGPSSPRPVLAKSTQTMALRDHKTKPWKSEYSAMGDNTDNSLDSRYWGALEQYNIVAPASFTLWPITTGHWGLIQ